ncbi:hypothetical protein [Calothrix sp. PCC 7507]|uniref:hypothetical protein n=1 Tax=Calothrix sp. PCC 7507 TaxID=99598 RepID=UPI0005A6FBDF|nr:hypothetical protein [Calothrix sp. PCC 7507]
MDDSFLSENYLHLFTLSLLSTSPAYIATPMTDAMMEKLSKQMGINLDEAIAGLFWAIFAAINLFQTISESASRSAHNESEYVISL